MTAKRTRRELGRDQAVDRQQAAVGISGRGGWSTMRPDDVQLAGQVRQAVWKLASRSKLTGERLDRQALALVKNHYPAAVPTFGAEAVAALTRRPGPGACSWCALRVLCASAEEPTPTPAPTGGLRALLGAQCSRCEVAFQAKKVHARERRALAAAGSPEELNAVRRRVARQQVTPTGSIRAVRRAGG